MNSNIRSKSHRSIPIDYKVGGVAVRRDCSSPLMMPSYRILILQYITTVSSSPVFRKFQRRYLISNFAIFIYNGLRAAPPVGAKNRQVALRDHRTEQLPRGKKKNQKKEGDERNVIGIISYIVTHYIHQSLAPPGFTWQNSTANKTSAADPCAGSRRRRESRSRSADK